TLGALAPGDIPGYVAPEPGKSAAWMSVELSQRSADLQTSSEEAHVAEVAGGGTVTEQTLGTNQGVGPRGSAGPIACPAANDCWMATTEGWLFHWTDGRALAQDTDPAFHTL